MIEVLMQIVLIFFALFFGGVMVFFGVLLLNMARKRLKTAFIVKRTKTSKISDIKEGMVELKGWIEQMSNKLVFTPVMDRPVVYYDTKVLEEREYSSSRGRRTKMYVPIWTRRDGLELILNDGTGKIRINPLGANVECKTMDRAQFPNGRGEVAERFAEFLERKRLRRNGISMLGSGRDLFLEERYLCPGQHIYVLGNAVRSRIDNELAKKLGVRTVTISKIARDMPFIISDRKEGNLALGKFAMGLGLGFVGIVVTLVPLVLAIFALYAAFF
ncbi:MAG: GIDE domain-containing protein [Thermoplasmatota archaeon]